TDAVLRMAREAGMVADAIGTVGGERLVVEVEADRGGPGCRVDVDLDILRDRWANSIKKAIGNGQ
ncbi:MAG: hypothetical protein ACREIK_01985, partial [Nitrospiraceae bacterium]